MLTVREPLLGNLTNYFSFTSYSYKVGLIRTLVDRACKVNNTWLGLHEDITKLMDILKKNLLPAHLIERVVNRYVTGTALSNHSPRVSLPTSPTFYFKLPYIGHFSDVTQKKVRHLIKRYCNDLDIKLVFFSFKVTSHLRGSLSGSSEKKFVRAPVSIKARQTLKRPRFLLLNLSGIVYRNTSKITTQCYSQGINQQKCVGKFW